jgi:hypothetical protein
MLLMVSVAYAEFPINSIMLRVIILSVVRLDVVALCLLDGSAG